MAVTTTEECAKCGTVGPVDVACRWCERRTVDGVLVKRGDLVWYWQGYGNVKQRKLDKLDLGYWWAWKIGPHVYSTEAAALDAALADEREDLRKAQRDLKRAKTTIARLLKRRKELP